MMKRGGTNGGPDSLSMTKRNGMPFEADYVEENPRCDAQAILLRRNGMPWSWRRVDCPDDPGDR
jgi:hypothetical protein